MRLDGGRRYLVTLGGGGVDPSSVIAEMTYSHPLYTHPEVGLARRLLPTLGDNRVVFAVPRLKFPRGRRLASGLRANAGDLPHHDQPLQTGPDYHSFAYRSHSWYVDVDSLPSCPGGCDRSRGFYADLR